MKSPLFLPAVRALSALAVLLAVQGSARAQIHFASCPVVRVQESWVMCSADFNGDGNIDVATLSGPSVGLNPPPATCGVITILLYSAGGTTAVPSVYATDPNAMDMTCGDLDGDGDVDLVTVNPAASPTYTNTNSVFLNNGAGVFAPPVLYGPYAASPFAVECADLDGDGDLDLFTDNGNLPSIVVYKNTGPAAFFPPAVYQSGADAVDVCALDFDSDGDLDIAMAEEYGTGIRILANVGGTAFQLAFAQDVGDRVVRITSGDLDGDGDPDLVLVKQITAKVAVLLNPGNGSAWTRTDYPTGVNWSPKEARCSDLDGDGDLDIVVDNVGNDSLSVFRNAGNGLFGAQEVIPVGDGPFAVRVADMDRDGDPDLIAAMGNKFVWVSFNRGAGVFEHQERLPVSPGGPLAAAALDWNGDGRLDLACLKNGPSGLAVLLNAGGGTFSPATVYATGMPAAFGMAGGDLDGDGDKDVVVTGGLLGVMLNAGTGQFTSLSLPTVSDPTLADFDGDGDLDLAGYGGGNTARVAFNDGTAHFTFSTPMSVGLAPAATVAGDFDGDGDIDLCTGGSTDLSVLLNEGNGTFAPAVSWPGAGTALATADVDGDGDLDFIVPNTPAGGVNVMWNDGSGSPAGITTLLDSLVASTVTCSDLNLDGMPDIVAGHYPFGSISVFQNLGAGSFAPPVHLGGGSMQQDVLAADLNGDGFPDLAAGEPGAESILWNEPFTGAVICGGGSPPSICPCGTPGSALRGCPNSAVPAGGELRLLGIARIAPDLLRLRVDGVPNGPALCLQGTLAADFPFGDGRLCVAGQLIRLGVAFGADNGFTYPPNYTSPPLSVQGSVPAAGGTRTYQVWYRDADPGFCTPSLFNLTNGVTVLWIP